MSDFDAVTMLGYQIVAAISGVQSARLLETSPKGWQSSGSLEDKNYSKTLEAIQKDDFTPILELHFKLLAKSRFGIDKKYTVIFDPIDNPTEKEQAEIREINSRTDATYINAGVVSAEEVRGVLRADENSGYNALSEEMEGEPLPDDEDDPFDMGGSPNEQAPFSMDDEPEKWITTKNNVHIPLEEGESKKEACKEFFSKKNNTNNSKNKNDIKLTGEELGKNLSGKELREKARDYYTKHLANTDVDNPKLGTVVFSQSGFNKPISSSKDERKLLLIPALRNIIATGDVSEPVPDKKQRPNVKGFYTITKNVILGDDKIKVRVTIREDNNGKLYYDHAIAKPMNETQDTVFDWEINIKIDS